MIQPIVEVWHAVPLGMLLMFASFGFFYLMLENIFDWRSNEAWGVLWLVCWIGFGLSALCELASERQAQFEDNCAAWGDANPLYSRNCLALSANGEGGNG